MLRCLHKDKKPGKMDNARHIGIGELNFTFGSVLSGHFLLVVSYQLSVVSPVGWVERIPTKNRTQYSVFGRTEKPEITKNRVKPNVLDTTS